MSKRLLSFEDLAGKGIPYSKSHIWRLVKARSFPAPIQFGSGRNLWVEAEVDAHIEKLIAERDAVAEVS